MQCSGERSGDGLWRIPFNTGQAANLVGIAGTADLVAFAHGALFSPAISTLQMALDRSLINGLPGLTSQSLWRFPPTVNCHA